MKLALFFILFLVLLNNVNDILKYPKQSEWNTKGMEKVYTNSDHYDVLFSGTSMAVTNMSAEELYSKYGIASYSIGEPEQMVFLSYYSLKEALKYQSPKIVLFDAQAMFYSEEREKGLLEDYEQTTAHYTLDSLKNGKEKYDAVTEIKKLHPSSTYWEYFSKMYYNHSNWENITEDNFESLQSKDIIMGNRSLTGILENVSENKYVSWEDNTGEEADILERNIEYLKKIANLCEERNVKLVLVRGYGSRVWTWSQYNIVSRLAGELDLDYLDLAVHEKEIGFNWITDTQDGMHHNVVGVKKWTDFLGQYLVDNYDFTDRRNDINYAEYAEQEEVYKNVLNAVEQKINLVSANHLDQYLDTLYNMEKEKNVIFISTNGEINLTETAQNFLNAMGLNIESKNGVVTSYCSVLDDGKIIVEENESSSRKGCLSDGTSFEIISSDTLMQEDASIKINDQELIQGGTGINIVVYNKVCKEVLSSVFFDTYTEENPITSRINGSGIVEKETGINYWEQNS